MNVSSSRASKQPAREPQRGDRVEFTLKKGAKSTGMVTSACVPASNRRQLTIRDGTGTRFTRLAASVTVITPAAVTPAAAPRVLGQQPGAASPNAGKRFAAEPLTSAEVSAIIAQCSRRAPTGIRNRALLTLFYRSGLRVSEALALRVSDVDLGRHAIRLLDTKSGEPQTRGFHPSADDALARWLDTRRQIGLPSHGRRLFCTLAGDPASEDYVRGLVRRLAAKGGIEKRVHPHAFRHTFAVELEAAGTPVTVISKLLGHSSVAVTARYLDHLTNGQAISALEIAELPELGDGK
jgi:integrase